LQLPAGEASEGALALMANTFERFVYGIFGLQESVQTSGSKMDDVMQVLMNIRKEARAKKDFATSDLIRNQLTEKGISIKDEKDGTVSWTINE
jgi:cysteinyl-tRNA synthetase